MTSKPVIGGIMSLSNIIMLMIQISDKISHFQSISTQEVPHKLVISSEMLVTFIVIFILFAGFSLKMIKNKLMRGNS